GRETLGAFGARARQPRHDGVGDAAAVQARHLDAYFLVLNHVAYLRRPLQQRHDEAAHRIDILVLDGAVELLAEFVEPHRAGHVRAAAGVPEDLAGRAGFRDAAE